MVIRDEVIRMHIASEVKRGIAAATEIFNAQRDRLIEENWKLREKVDALETLVERMDAEMDKYKRDKGG